MRIRQSGLKRYRIIVVFMIIKVSDYGGFFTVHISLGRFLSKVVDTKYDEIRNTVTNVFNVVK